MHKSRQDEKLFIIAPLDAPRKAVGTVGLTHIDSRNRRAEWGRFLIGDSSSHGKGFGSEAIYLSLKYAFLDLRLERVYLEVYNWNEPAKSLYEKIGFKFEGIYRSHVYSGGRFHDVAVYGLLRSEFLHDENKILDAINASANHLI